VGVRPSAILLEGQKLALSRLENPAMGGLGLFVRGDLSPSFGLELGFDYLVGGERDFRQRTMPLMLSAVYRFFPASRLNPYAVAGVGVHITELSYAGGSELHELWEPAGQLGAGVRVQLTDSLELFGDVRALAVYKNLGTETYSDCGHGAPCGAADPNDRFNVGAQFSAGLAYRF
jgi:opacity protein-like surface antigen